MSDIAPIDAPGPEHAAPDDHPYKGDLTRGPILRTLVVFSVPALLANVIQTINGSINTIWVGRLLGEGALAATANANIIMFLMFGTLFGFGMATTVKVGQYFGGRDIVAARRSFGAGVGFCTLLAVGIALLGAVFAPDMLALMGTPQSIRGDALAYLRVIFVSLPFAALAMLVSMGLRGSGDSTTPLHATLLTVVLDIVLNPPLILGLGPLPALGVAGSAAATAIANLFGAGLMIWRLYARDLPLRLRGPELGFLAPRGEELGYIAAKGVPMGAQILVSSAAGVVMVGLVNREGLYAAAAYGMSLQLWNYIQMPAVSLGSAVSAMVAQYIGAGLHHKVGKVTWVGVWLNLLVTGALSALIIVFDRPIVALFLGADSPAAPIARHIQLVCTWSFGFTGVMMVLIGTMRAYGAVLLPLLVMFIALYPARLGFYFLTYPEIGADALWWSYPVGSVVALALSLLAYARGPWRGAQGAQAAAVTS